MKHRTLVKAIQGTPTSDGAGVKLTRLIGGHSVNMLDPFLLFDCFESDNSDDYIGGFPEHPHRGFETVTYLTHGNMRHKDSAGNEGVIKPGGVQWMTAGKGILHSEMPEQTEGLLHGFQLWVNLPSHAKMTSPQYQEFPTKDVPLVTLDNGAQVRVISGHLDNGQQGAVQNAYTDPTYLDVTIEASSTFSQQLPHDHNGFIYVINGQVSLAEQSEPLNPRQLGILSHGEQIDVTALQANTRFLLIAGQPLNEPVVRGGPFVMNTRAELQQAFTDYQNGQF